MEDRMKAFNTRPQDVSTGSERKGPTRFPSEDENSENREGELFEEIKPRILEFKKDPSLQVEEAHILNRRNKNNSTLDSS